jgi:hypothetical protein
VCRDLQTERGHCGACGNACGDTQTCTAGMCVTRCGGGQSVCSGQCVDLTNDPRNCGMCGRSCASGLSCAAGSCGAVCAAPLSSCSGSCVDTRYDPQHCGACGRPCAVPNAVAACGSGTCVVGACVPGFGNCDGESGNGCETNTQTSAAHCGACGRACSSGQTCADGVCLTPCASGETRCNGACVNLATSNANCGACGNVCGAGQSCVNSVCANANGTVLDVNGATLPVLIVPCGNGSITNCTESVARASCSSIGRRLVSHASNGTTDVASLGATSSCQHSISYYTNNNPAAANQCLVGVSNSQWSDCCTPSRWHGNTVRIPATLGQQFGYVWNGNSGYRSNLNNVNGTGWGCINLTEPAQALSGCSAYFVACR